MCIPEVNIAMLFEGRQISSLPGFPPDQLRFFTHHSCHGVEHFSVDSVLAGASCCYMNLLFLDTSFRFGRKVALIISIIVTSIASMVSAFSNGPSMMAALRFFVGFGSAGIFGTCFVLGKFFILWFLNNSHFV